jgi:DNA-binding response OmpR family regulator
MKDILLIEDNGQLQKYLCEYLQTYGFSSHVLEDYDAVVDTVMSINPKLILLDITLPKFDGFYYLRLIRKYSQIPVIILSARSDEAEQIRGIEGGAYDYITKPFSIGVLIAKINALLTRARSADEDLHFAGLSLSKNALTLSRGDVSIELSKNEYKILSLLLSRAGQYVSREEILEVLWDDASFVDDNTLTVNISRVKKKIQEFGLTDAILTKRGLGYAFNAACNKND